jgi:hypothetical protein
MAEIYLVPTLYDLFSELCCMIFSVFGPFLSKHIIQLDRTDYAQGGGV